MKKYLTLFAFLFLLFDFQFVFAREDEEDDWPRLILPNIVLPTVPPSLPKMLVTPTTSPPNQAQTLVDQQNAAQKIIAGQLKIIDNQNKLSKLLFGPDIKVLAKLKQLLVENITRAEQFRQLQLNNLAQIVDTENIQLQNKIKVEESAKSLFGWFFSWLNQK